MVVLGLLPPYALEDVREAYRQKALTAHPDRGGDPAAFARLSEAYDRAVEYVTFQGDRRAWIANQVECHLLQEEVAAEVRGRKGTVDYERMDWVKASWGDGFEALADRLRSIRVHGQADGDAFLAFLGSRNPPYLTGLDVADCRVTDDGLRSLSSCGGLHWLDLSGTAVSYAGLLAALEHLPSLARLNVRGTSVGWLRRRQLARHYPRVTVLADASIEPTPASRLPPGIMLPDR
jgi:hypothetical protein